MRGRELVHVVDFAVRSAAAVERIAVPGGVTFFGVTDGCGSRGRLCVFRMCGRWRRAGWHRRVALSVIDGFCGRRRGRSWRGLAISDRTPAGTTKQQLGRNIEQG